MESGRCAVTAGSSCRTAPAAELRGLAKSGSPRSARSAFMRSKPLFVMYTSPRASNADGHSPRSASGTVRMVRRLAVTFSPRRPSPRVAPCASRPFS